MAEAWCYSARKLICVSPAVCDFVKSRSARSHPGRRAEECPPRRALSSLRWLRVPLGTRTDMGLLKHFPGAGGGRESSPRGGDFQPSAWGGSGLTTASQSRPLGIRDETGLKPCGCAATVTGRSHGRVEACAIRAIPPLAPTWYCSTDEPWLFMMLRFREKPSGRSRILFSN